MHDDEYTGERALFIVRDTLSVSDVDYNLILQFEMIDLGVNVSTVPTFQA